MQVWFSDSKFEMSLLEGICGKLAKSGLQVSQKLLISLVCDYFENFAGTMAKVLLFLVTQSLTYHQASPCLCYCRRSQDVADLGLDK